MRLLRPYCLILLSSLLLTACGGGSDKKDTTAPVITLNGEAQMNQYLGNTFTDPGATAVDDFDGSVTVTVTGAVDSSQTGEYSLTYSATDKAGNQASVVRTVIVQQDTQAPVITINGDEVINIVQNKLYAEIGAVAIDNADGEVDIIIDGTVNTAELGQYDVVYSAVDKSGNESSISRTVNVVDPESVSRVWGFMLAGNAEMHIAKGVEFVDPGAFKYYSTAPPVRVNTYGDVDSNVVDEYQLYYQYKNGDVTYNLTRTVKVVDSLIPDESPLVIEISAKPACEVCVMTSVIELPVSSEGDYVIEWAEGHITKNRSSFHYQDNTNSFKVREIKIYGADAVEYACAVKSWGSRPLTSLDYMFAQSDTHACDFTLPDTPLDTSRITSAEGAFARAIIENSAINQLDLSQITNMTRMFQGAKIKVSLSDFDVSNVTNMEEMFRGATFSQGATLLGWDVSSVTNMSGMFRDSRDPSGFSSWDVSQVTDMSHMFQNTCSIDDITAWDVSNVKNMNYMFANILQYHRGGPSHCFYTSDMFNQPIGIWDVSNVETMQGMFSSSKGFNQPLENWNVAKVTDMSYMFNSACFNQPLNDWDVSNVHSMKGMFRNLYAYQNNCLDEKVFNQPLDKWNVANVTDMRKMFEGNYMFNHPIAMWDVANVTSMTRMFYGASAFNQALNNWNVSKVTDMSHMFESADKFNQPLNEWNVSRVQDMRSMFAYADNFNQPLNNWNVSNVLSMRDMFYSTDVFDQDISDWVLESLGREDVVGYMFDDIDESNPIIIEKEEALKGFLNDRNGFSSENYDKLLTQWPNNDLAEGLTLVVNSEYTQAGAAGRDILINQFGWTINDKGLKQETLK